MGSLNKLLNSVRYDKAGLVPCVIQDAKDSSVLMVAYMNRRSLRITLEKGRCCFWSRSRNKFWIKGETSGNYQVVKKIQVDCDMDCILIKVKQIGGAACHTGMKSCFYREMGRKGSLKIIGKKIFDPEKVYK